MEPNYVSDAVELPPVAVMDEPFCTITLDLSLLGGQQALMLAQQIGLDRVDEADQWKAGRIMAGENVEFESEIELHLDAQTAMQMLGELDLVDTGQEDPEAQLEEINDDEGDDGD